MVLRRFVPALWGCLDGREDIGVNSRLEAQCRRTAWLAVARYRIDGLDTCLAPLMRLALLAPERLSIALAEIDDPLLQRDWNAFHVACDWLDPDDVTADAWFPAWYLVEHPGVRLGADDATSSPATQAAQTFSRDCAPPRARKARIQRGTHFVQGTAARSESGDVRAFYMARRDVHRSLATTSSGSPCSQPP